MSRIITQQHSRGDLRPSARHPRRATRAHAGPRGVRPYGRKTTDPREPPTRPAAAARGHDIASTPTCILQHSASPTLHGGKISSERTQRRYEIAMDTPSSLTRTDPTFIQVGSEGGFRSSKETVGLLFSLTLTTLEQPPCVGSAFSAARVCEKIVVVAGRLPCATEQKMEECSAH